MKVFLTGATGFVGSHVARVYAEAGAQLRLLTRSSSNVAALEGLDAEVVVGDLRDAGALRSAIAGCEAVVHVAADYRLWVRDPKAMYAANVDGTRELLRMARETGVRRVVYTSSVATMGFKTDGTIVNEDTPVSVADMIGHYKRSKFLGEQEAIKAARAGQEVMILNPTTPIGAADRKPTPTGQIIVDFLNRKFPAYVETGLNLVDVGEVARMHRVALERGQAGRAVHPGRREPDAEADSGSDVVDYGAAVADDEGAACGGDGVCVLRREHHRQAARQGAAGDGGGGADGQKDDVCLGGQGGAGAGLQGGAGVCGAADGD